MHEYALTKRIVGIANDAARERDAARVMTVRLVIGENSGVIDGSIQLYFDMIAKGTAAEGARIIERMVKAQMRCPACEEDFARPRFSFQCPKCGTLGRPTAIGNEFYVESIEIERAGNDASERI